MEKKSNYTLPEIANWGEEKKVSLPTVQRGFVWKPAQLENLWDSLLRGYPVGAFVLSDDGKGNLHILDGQQRATAICLGFAKQTFRNSKDYYRVFIDLERPEAGHNRKYVFRVITKSHPWGYRQQDNAKTLTIAKIRSALELYECISDPLKTSLDYFFPYDADLPVPLHYFLNAATANPVIEESEIIKKIKAEFQHWSKIVKNWKEKQSKALDELSEVEIESKLDSKISHIYKAVKVMLDPDNGQRIPAIYMDLARVINLEEEGTSNDSDEVENLFVRLNSGGTQLSGEELNYSILKVHLEGEVQDEIEEACKLLFKPARFITIAFRLYQQQNKDEEQRDGLSMRIKPKQFQQTIGKNAKAFEVFILELIRNKEFEEKSLLEYAQSVLAYNSSNPKHFGLPYLIYSKIADVSPELMFLLLYRIKFKKDLFSDSAEEKHRTMLGMLTLFMWFGRGENLKDHSKLLSNIWPAANKLDQERFWSAETVERAHLNNVLLPIPAIKSNKNEKGLEIICKSELRKNSDVIKSFIRDTSEDYHLFIQKVFYAKDLIIYAQRHFIESYFGQEQYRMEDTSLPFDWDHISPNNFVRRIRNVPKIVKDWYQTNGNLRVWPYALNRMDRDKCPAYKFNPLEKFGEETEKKDIIDKWQIFIKQNKNLISNKNQISPKILEWSYCNEEWLNLSEENLNTNWQPVTHQIIYRNYSLVEEWFSQLKIVPFRKKYELNMDSFFDKRKWEYFKEDIYNIRQCRLKFTLKNQEMGFYFRYGNDEDLLLTDNVLFGLFLTDTGELYEMKKFTLISGQLNSFCELILEMGDWLLKLPLQRKEKEILRNEFSRLFQAKLEAYI